MKQETIDSAYFKQRLAALCVESGLSVFPRKGPDRLILLKSVVLTLNAEQVYTEAEINAALQTWLKQVGFKIETDHVMLRRLLVDDGFLQRERDGSAYRAPTTHRHSDLFDPAVETIDVNTVIQDTQTRIAKQKRLYEIND
jgi:hypothetical protein